MRRLPLALVIIVWAGVHAGDVNAQSSDQHDARTALAGRFVRHAVNYCGYEASPRGAALSTKDFGKAHDANTLFAQTLWRGTFACEKAYIGTSCMAARLTLCQRTFAEYGPEGALVPGLLKPIIHK